MAHRRGGAAPDLERRFLVLTGVAGGGKTQLPVLEQGVRYGARGRDLVGARRKVQFLERERDHLRRTHIGTIDSSHGRGRCVRRLRLYAVPVSTGGQQGADQKHEGEQSFYHDELLWNT
ncbi:hypothetical protein D5041_06205 [Verminephrobacter aporrectodeae subsp. tuberculatae]|nr:hypothetical protein [Verminephrobacter aporrectodeae subsp. tuberculatae]MCW5288664.1 hypothetical protein [Verminephrobacter aporrectodeae subsp. tuberculatae]